MATVTTLGYGTGPRAAEVIERNLPTTRLWRTNLTGLSAISNLYFVARAEEICVYRPNFPHQSLDDIPHLRVSTAPSCAHLSGDIDPRTPHTINSLVVQHLGDEEVVAVVRDDGDVDAYLVRHFVDAIARQVSTRTDQPGLTAEVRPIFHRNVGKSAWGLAIHTSARLIAVSSNSHKIDIFSFGLVHSDASHGSPATQPLSGRYHDEHYEMQHGDTNIPFVAFCNTGDDPAGSWLLSIDISGLVRSWDLREMEASQGIYLGRIPRYTKDHNRISAGWTVSFLDTKLFREVGDLEDAGVWPLRGTNRAVWDQSGTRPGSDFCNTFDVPSRDRADSSDDNDHDQAISTTPRDFAAPRATIVSAGEVRESSVSEDVRSTPGSVVERSESESEDTDWLEQRPLPCVTIEDDSSDARNAAGNVNTGRIDRSLLISARDILMHELDMGRPVESMGTARRRNDTRASKAGAPVHVQLRNDRPLCGTLPCPILVTSITDMHLLQPAPPASLSSLSSPSSASGMFPIMFMGSYFRQELSDELCLAMQDGYDIGFFERCSLLAHIPPLGIVVVGDQKGRVAVLSGVRARRRVKFPLSPSRRVDTVRWVYALKLEALLPFASQETRGERPLTGLYGLAVGPLQGTYDLPVEQRRWRLMMMYHDETILSYEIGRKRSGKVDDGFEIII